MDFEEVKDEVSRLTEPVARAEGVELVCVEVRPERGRMVLTLYLDREGGITLDELAAMSRQLSDILDVHEVMKGRYLLEVSSPGVNRPLTRPQHFKRVVGGRVRVRTREPISGRSSFVGVLQEAGEESITMRASGEPAVRVIPYVLIKRANYEHDFSARPGSSCGLSAAGKERVDRRVKEG